MAFVRRRSFGGPASWPPTAATRCHGISRRQRPSSRPEQAHPRQPDTDGPSPSRPPRGSRERRSPPQAATACHEGKPRPHAPARESAEPSSIDTVTTETGMNTCARPSAASDDAWPPAAALDLPAASTATLCGRLAPDVPAKTLDAPVSNVFRRRTENAAVVRLRLACGLVDAPVSNNAPAVRRSLPGKTLYKAGRHPEFFPLKFSAGDSTAGIGRAMDKEWCGRARGHPFIARYGAPKVATKLRLSRRKPRCLT